MRNFSFPFLFFVLSFNALIIIKAQTWKHVDQYTKYSKIHDITEFFHFTMYFIKNYYKIFAMEYTN